jgi:serine acetyltransferase
MGDISVGDNRVIGAGSMVNKNIPKNAVVYNERKLKISKREL